LVFICSPKASQVSYEPHAKKNGGYKMKTNYSNLAGLLEAFFINRLMEEVNASTNTISSYKDTFKMLLNYTYKRLNKLPSNLMLTDLSVDLILGFLKYLEEDRKVSPRSRNQKLAAIRSFFKYVSFKAPESISLVQQVLCIPSKKHNKRLVKHLNPNEVSAILNAIDQNTWLGRRDHALLVTALQTGLRVSELTSLTKDSIKLGTCAYIKCIGKGRKERNTPLTSQTEGILKKWLKEVEGEIFFPSIHGERLSSDSVQYLVKKYSAIAAKSCPSLKNKNISPHVLRHTTAMKLLNSGVDRSVIALWLGHEKLETTQVYLDADLELKKQTLAKTAPINTKLKRFKATDSLLSFLESL
jgi:integrase/recombinase XerD